MCQCLSGCITLRYDQLTDGSDVKPIPKEFLVGTTTLADVLAFYGAPANIANMEGRFALFYQKAFYHGGQISAGIPLSEMLRSSPKFDAMGNLQRYDAAVFVFKPDGILSEMSYVKGTDLPMWNTFWKY